MIRQGRGRRTYDHPRNTPITTARLLRRHKAAEGRMAFRCGRPPNWASKAGQRLVMTLLDKPGMNDQDICAKEFAATEPMLLPNNPYTR
jgi:hypothetical protein